MLDETPVTDVTPPSASADQPSDETTETVESLREKLAAEQMEKEQALEEAKRWKGRVKDENPPKKKEDSDEAYSDWRIDNKDRISVPGVKEKYDAELAEFQAGGSKLSISLREKALRLAESSVGVKKVDPSEPLPSPSIDRGGQREPTLTAHDIAFGVKPETKKKYAHLVEA